jgi:hypothetical protein
MIRDGCRSLVAMRGCHGVPVLAELDASDLGGLALGQSR